jgi:hypothetical protein
LNSPFMYFFPSFPLLFFISFLSFNSFNLFSLSLDPPLMSFLTASSSFLNSLSTPSLYCLYFLTLNY